MIDHNLETVTPHDTDECEAGKTLLRAERDRARRWAVHYENETRRLEDELAVSRRTALTYSARLQAHGIPLPGDDIQGHAV